MFNWLFKKFQLEPPKLTRDDVEQSRKAPGYSSESKAPVQKIDLEFPKCVYDLAAEELLKRIKNNQVKIPQSFIVIGKSKPPKHRLKTILVPCCDYELMKSIRIAMAQGQEYLLLPPEQNLEMYEETFPGETNVDRIQFDNAWALHDCYGLSKQEVLELTGCYLK